MEKLKTSNFLINDQLVVPTSLYVVLKNMHREPLKMKYTGICIKNIWRACDAWGKFIGKKYMSVSKQNNQTLVITSTEKMSLTETEYLLS